MDIHDLGPLETAALAAFCQAELIAAPLTVASLWRSLPGYTTTLPNVRAALAPGAPLRCFVSADKDYFALQDNEDLLRGMASRQGRADARWRALKSPLRGLGKLPWVEAVGVTGTMAWGLLDGEDAPCELVVIAEGGRVPLARAAVRAWRKAARLGGSVRIAAVLDGDDLTLPPAGRTAAWWLLAVRPVVNETAFARLLAANQWATSEFPSFAADNSGGLPEYFLGERLDGRLAALRRRAVAEHDDGVLLRSDGRRDPLWESRLLSLVSTRPIAQPCGEWVDADRVDLLAAADLADGDERVRRRMAEVAGWAFGAATEQEPADETEPADEVASADEQEPADEPEPAATGARAVSSRRSRGPVRRRATSARSRRSRTAAAPESGH